MYDRCCVADLADGRVTPGPSYEAGPWSLPHSLPQSRGGIGSSRAQSLGQGGGYKCSLTDQSWETLPSNIGNYDVNNPLELLI